LGADGAALSSSGWYMANTAAAAEVNRGDASAVSAANDAASLPTGTPSMCAKNYARQQRNTSRLQRTPHNG
jgi:hypothetical protein